MKNPRLRGYYANVTKGMDAKPVIRKTFGKKIKIAAKKETFQLINLHKKYISKARKIGIPIVQSKIEYVEEKEKNSFEYIEIQSCVNEVLSDIFKKSSDKKQIKNLLEQYLRIFKRSWDNQFTISLDASTNNFGVDNHKRVTYFDFFSPSKTNR